MRRLALIPLVALLALPAPAGACSRDDKSYFDSFPDASCLLAQEATEIDIDGGVRLTTDGEVVQAQWATGSELDDGILGFGRLDSTLERTGSNGADGALALTATTLALTPGGQVLGAREAPAPDNDAVGDPAVIKDAGGYVMYYTGRAEDGRAPALFRATSADGLTWARAGEVLAPGAEGSFDEHGVYGADVVYDASDTDAPYRMWYSGIGDTFTQIGYATSGDGVTWERAPAPALGVGLPGSRDSFTVAQPSVLFDGGLWKMWYEGDDSRRKSIGYATSVDGASWSRAGTVIEAEDGGGNTEFGVFAPSVYRSGDGFEMLLGGRKEVSNGVFQTKLLEATSGDGLTWTGLDPALNVGNGVVDLDAPDVLLDGAGAKLYYAIDSVDGEGLEHTRVALKTSASGASWGGTGQLGDTVLGLSTAGTAFDARNVGGLNAAAAASELVGVYWGQRAGGLPRLGLAASADGTGWARLAVTGAQADGAMLALGAGGTFDERGQRDPHLLHAPDGDGTADWFTYFTGISATGGTRSIGLTATTQDGVTERPAGPWSATTQVLAPDGAGFDATGVSHPSVIDDGDRYVMYFTGANGSATEIGRVSTADAAPPAGPFTTSRAQVVLNGAATCDPAGRRDPVVAKLAASDYRMLYTGLFAAADGTRTRTCYATSTDGVTWTRAGVALNPSQAPFAHDERAVTPSSIIAGASELRVLTTGTGRDGRSRAGTATATLPTPASPEPSIPSGWATYQFGDATTAPRDFRTLTQTSTGAGTEIWMSVLQPYSSAGNEYWSDFFPVSDAAGETELNLLLTVRAVRLQVRMRAAEEPPVLEAFAIGHAPVRFAPAGSATTSAIAPPETFVLQSWTSMTVESSLLSFGAGTGTAALTVLDAQTGAEVVPKTTLSPPAQTIPLAAVDAAAHPALKLRLDLTSSQEQTTPRIESVKVDYSALAPSATPVPPVVTPAPPPPPPPAVLTLAASRAKVVYGRPVTLSGTLTQAGAGLVGQTVAVLAAPRGAAAPVAAGTAATATGGTWSLAVTPRKLTTYSAAVAGVAAPAAVSVQVAHRVSLKVRLRGRRATLSGAIGPRHRRRAVTLQRRTKAGWRKLARVRTNRRSRFTASARLGKGTQRLRAITKADADHAAGRSPVRRVRVR